MHLRIWMKCTNMLVDRIDGAKAHHRLAGGIENLGVVDRFLRICIHVSVGRRRTSQRDPSGSHL